MRTCRYVCSYPGCGKRFGYIQSKKEHEFKHEGVKPYVCQVPGCGKAYASSSNAKRHMKRVHNHAE